MKILFIYRHPSMGFSIGKVFRPIEEEMKKYAEVDSIYMPTSQYSLNSIWQNIKTTRKAINSKKYDIVHITGTEHYLIPFLLGEKVVVTVHDLGHYFDIHGLKKILFWIMQIFSLKFAKAITCISNFTVQELKKTISIKNNKISVIFNEVDKNFSFKEKEFNKDYPVILHIGTRPHKNLSRTIKALNGIKCKLRIIGEITNKELDLLQKYKTDYSFASNLSDNDLLKEYQNADIINFPSCHEGFGMPIIEGQAVGRIVVTSNIEPMISVANNGAAICDPYNIESIRNTYIRVINDFQYRNDIILKGIDNVKKYSIETVAKQYFELYKTL
jgi:glycosyltransferase family 4